tara:strand:+ start:706 stop:957 length:252 start_codon:yes stop_codon:yes gene_type:complete
VKQRIEELQRLMALPLTAGQQAWTGWSKQCLLSTHLAQMCHHLQSVENALEGDVSERDRIWLNQSRCEILTIIHESIEHVIWS